MLLRELGSAFEAISLSPSSQRQLEVPILSLFASDGLATFDLSVDYRKWDRRLFSNERPTLGYLIFYFVIVGIISPRFCCSELVASDTEAITDTIVMNFVTAYISKPGGHRGDYREEQHRRENALAEQQSIGAGYSAARPQQCPLQRVLSRKRSASYFRGWFSNVASPSSHYPPPVIR